GEPYRMAGTVLDISDRKQVELALQESEEHYRFLVEHTSDMVFRIGLRQPLPLDLPLERAVDWIFREAYILAVNEGFLRAYGYEQAAELVGKPMTVVVPRTPENEVMERALVTNGHSIVEARTEELDRQGRRKVMLNSIVGRIQDGYVYDYIGTAKDITERVLAEEALAAEEQRYRYIFESVGVAIWEADFSEVKAAIERLRASGLPDLGQYFAAHPDFGQWAAAVITILDVNHLTLKLTGAADKQQLLSRLNEIYLPETFQAVVEQLLAIAAGETFVQTETVIKTLTGQQRYVLVTTTFPPVDQPYDHVLVTWTDISDRKQAEIVLRDQEQRLQQLSDSMPQFVWMSNAQGELDYVNRQWLDYSGLTLKQSRDPALAAACHHPDEVQQVQEQWAKAKQTQQIYEQEMRLRCASDGTYRWFLVRGVPILDAQGQVQRWYGTSTDIHDRKLAELNTQFLNDLDLQLRQLSDPEAMIWRAVSRLGEQLQVDRCLWHEIDWPQQSAIVARHWRRDDVSDLTGTYALADLFTPAQIARFAAGQTLAVADLTTHPDTAAYVNHYPPDTAALIGVPCIQSGTWIAALSVTTRTPRPWREDEVALLQTAVVRLWPLIQQTKAAQAVRESELRFRTLADNIAQLAWIADENGSVFWYNQRWFDYTGTTLEQVQDWGWQQVHHPEHLERVVARLRHCFTTGEIWEDTFPLRGQDGQYRWFLSRAVPIRNEQGQVWRWFGTNTDITERQQAAADLQERNSHIQLLYEMTRDLLSTEQPLTLVDSVFAKLKSLIGLDVYFNYMLEQERLRLGFFGGISDETARQVEWLELGKAICGTVALQQRQIVQFDLQSSTDPKTELVRSLGLTAYACQPLVAQGKLFGTLGFGSRSRDQFTVAETKLFQAICDQIAIALERAELMTSLQHQTTELIQANHLKDEFLAALSHELRTPLNPILGWTKLMQAQQLSAAKTTEALAAIERNAKQQISLVNDLLDLSNLIQGNLNLDLQPVDILEPLHLAMAAIQPAAQAKAIGITLLPIRLSSSATPLVLGDQNRLRQVFWNLLSNAVKFTPEGGRIELEIANILSENGSSYVQIRISDNGIGISPEFLPYVFDRFRQADGSSTRQYGGLGLGLSLVRHLVELQGGTVTAASPGLGQGTSFTVRLPHLQAGALGRDADKPIAQSTALGLNGAQILLVDDDADNLDLLRFLLQQNGAVVTALTSPIEALQLVSESFPQLIISDIGMPEMTGYEFIRQVQASRPERPIPALAFTAFASREDQLASLTAGFQAYIPKPVDPLQFLAVVRQLVTS
ncbi:MAG: PAS domain S-box protein, partial [Elainella sp.]